MIWIFLALTALLMVFLVGAYSTTSRLGIITQMCIFAVFLALLISAYRELASESSDNGFGGIIIRTGAIAFMMTWAFGVISRITWSHLARTFSLKRGQFAYFSVCYVASLITLLATFSVI